MPHNLYWASYKRIEKDFLELAQLIHISDDQLNIYSSHIGSMIIRCAVEIESIAKELYKRLGGCMTPVDANGESRDLYFDTDCMGLLENTYILSEKTITISCPYVYLDNEQNQRLTPLKKANKRGTSGSRWKQAYQAIKHDRNASLKKATIENLLNAMGALFILNLYYKGENKKIGRYTSEVDDQFGSDVFVVDIFNAGFVKLQLNMDDSCILNDAGQDIKKALFITKATEKSFREIHQCFLKDVIATKRKYDNDPVVREYLQSHPEDANKSLEQVCDVIGDRVFKRVLCVSELSHYIQSEEDHYEIILNTNTTIYPELHPEADYPIQTEQYELHEGMELSND